MYVNVHVCILYMYYLRVVHPLRLSSVINFVPCLFLNASSSVFLFLFLFLFLLLLSLVLIVSFLIIYSTTTSANT